MVIRHDVISYDMVVYHDMVICNDIVTCFDTVVRQDRLSIVTLSYDKCEIITYRGTAHSPNVSGQDMDQIYPQDMEETYPRLFVT